ncbi:NAD(FAD)-utilizing dehydrogenase [Proteus hauseri ATCC 700826]|uniref:NAD(FAD)-utilizing dehydrogenase n=1 Tax=Proteus hauseri ATCC 700826 TaxID=1354271 RepID=A0AAJ3LVH2_PROHU|nr:NAD(P)/FAD-dependent oxidoreductase [Proteus hauseri]OAT50896.1 NAD(FAD)-utilizing dehydrogenase [Proteus hauseri ATCC 700826]
MGSFDTVIIGAGAAGLFCASIAGQAGLSVLVLDNGKKAGRKILMSGGGRCNFTNMYIEPSAYLSENPHFCKSALARYTQWDFIELVQKYKITYHEKTLGQLFCDDSAQQIVDLLLTECQKGKVSIRLRSEVTQIEKIEDGFTIFVDGNEISTPSVVIASGGLSMPGLGATPFGYRIAEQFNLPVLPTRAGLVPFTLHKPLLEQLNSLSGVAVPAIVTAKDGTSFKENILFTHRGLSGPAILQISSYWHPGEYVSINLLPNIELQALLQAKRQEHPNQSLKNTLSRLLPKRLIEIMIETKQLPDVALAQLSNERIEQIVTLLQSWQVQPNGTEGYRTAEVTLGGVDTRALSSKTMQASSVKGLYFIGEVVDVTGWLGGYNFQWAWSSAYACAQALISMPK